MPHRSSITHGARRAVLTALLMLLGVMRWGGDAEGGAPYVEADPNDPAKVRGFDVEIAELLAASMGRTPQFVQAAFTTLDQSVKRGDFELALSGLEDSAAKRAELGVSVPYYQFSEVLTVREADRARFRTLKDLAGKKVATLSGTLAWEILTAAQRDLRIEPVSYDDDVHPYADLANGRVAIARALAADPRLLLMDEPTASLDPARRGELGDTLRKLTAKGRSLLLTCHDDDFVRNFATRVVVLADGEVVEEGDPRTVLTSPKHEATKRLLDVRSTEQHG